jgi:hypothetical protein
VPLQEVPLHLRRCEQFKNSYPFLVQEYMCSMKIQNSASRNILLHSKHKFSYLKMLRCAELSGLLTCGNMPLGDWCPMFQYVVVSFWKVTSMICCTSGRPLLRCQCMNKVWDASQLPFNLFSLSLALSLSLSLSHAHTHTHTHTHILEYHFLIKFN